MTTVLVTGGTGQLGAPTVVGLRASGHDVRVLSRKSGPGLVTADVVSGRGVAEAVAGVDVVVHLVSTIGKDDPAGKGDLPLAARLVEEAKAAGVGHLVFISIIGVDKIPLPYYKTKLAVKELLRESAIAHTVLRIAQFHSLVEQIFAAQRFLPVLFAPAFSVQPIDVGDAANKIVEIVSGAPQGRAADIAGPRAAKAAEWARQWKASAGSRKPVVPLWLPGKTFAGYAAGHNLAPEAAYGTTTFAEYLAARRAGAK
ncbi:SDR family oxidoreductase [Segniliparus rugosus]|uniref:NAD(P)-binding domain-containing protein n=1 Tax=Segniliparus rugosus (strain ATCC BAA-974 / DSM 45345 / CCUG 50838 / CIP 108380 / JCM 13579 / CDC 945) TaxID=679197 RepID=E5XNG9_SEGRC|nr:NAD(P)H-binding protein [Segniliparus rugosus]EFV14081.1 hypothetical protein HMPREF9336_00998 [Segniliparus rugosus ATCC BAA-974]